MKFTQKQVSDILTQLLEEENGLNTVLKLTLEALMKSDARSTTFPTEITVMVIVLANLMVMSRCLGYRFHGYYLGIIEK